MKRKKRYLLFFASIIPCIFAAVFLLDSNRASTKGKLTPVSPHKTNDYMLSSLNVTAISQDNQKLVWIGTSAGINVFNGTSYTQFFHDPKDTTALPDDYINVLFRDKEGSMWVGTQNGLARYEGGYQFHRVKLPDSNENVVGIAQEGDHLVVDNGKRRFMVSHDQVEPYKGKNIPSPMLAVSPDLTSDIAKALGVKDSREIDQILRKPKELISTIYKDAGGNLWIGYRNAGYEVMSKNSAIYALANKNELAKTTKGMDITCLSTLGRQVLAGTTLRLFIYDTQTSRLSMSYYKDIFHEPASHKQELTNMVTLDANKVCLVGTHEIVSAEVNGEKLSLGSRASRLPLLGCGTNSDAVYASCEAPYIIRYKYGSGRADSLAFDNKWYDEESQLTTLANGDILLFMKDMHVAIHSVKTGKTSELRLKGTENALNVDPAFARQDSRGLVWLGTKRSGLYRLDLNKKEVRRVNVVNDVHVQGLQEDKNGQLWITTLKDATCYQPSTGAVLMSSLVSSSQNEWNRQYFDNSICQAPDGDLIILGSSDGCIFLPCISGDKELSANTTVRNGRKQSYDNPTSLEKGLFIYGIDVRTTDDRNLTVNDYHSQDNIQSSSFKEPHYTFAYDENDLTLKFFYPNYSRRSSLQFQYMLEGYDKDWGEPTYAHNAHFSNLSPGEYTFHLRLVSSPDLPPLAERTVRITVKSSFWASPAAWMFYLLVLAALAFYISRLYLRIRTNKMQLALEQRANKMNMSFFANISHEFRNPITIIAGPLLALKSNTTLPPQVQTTLNRVCISVNRMLRLIDQMLDFNQLETDALRLKVARVDASQELRNITAAFEESTKVRNITFTARFPEEMNVWMDADKFEKILSNLFTNALKHTPEQGKIRIEASISQDDLYVMVFNSGSKIEEDKMQDVFKRYYQLQDTQTEHHYGWGTGIGLYYVKQLATLHHGDVGVRNVLPSSISTESGVEFFFRLPILRDAYTEQELSSEKSGVMQIPISNNLYEGSAKESEESNQSKAKLLVVDDDIDVAQYIRSIFASDYIVENRYSAEEALADMESIRPDIILSDIIMGDMSGYEFCKTVKSNLMFSHIPVILVTAKSNIDEQIEGLKLGAVAYITKPFDPTYLRAMVESQLHNMQTLRQRLGESTQTEALTQSESDSLSEQDRKFMDELYALMEKRAAELDLNVTAICHDLLISQSKFTYKLKELTGDTPGAFFRKYKLNRAAKYLVEGKHNVSEIALMTGFSTAAHFSVAFKKQFGVSPSEYK